MCNTHTLSLRCKFTILDCAYLYVTSCNIPVLGRHLVVVCQFLLFITVVRTRTGYTMLVERTHVQAWYLTRCEEGVRPEQACSP